MTKSLVQEQFGATAAHYLTSKPHAKGKSLERLVELVQPQPAWRALDVATGAGHTAYAFAPHVARVWATDITEEMLALVRDEIAKRNLANVRVAYAKAEALPFEDQSFDLVTCRIAPHHFDSIAAFLTRRGACSNPARRWRSPTISCRPARSAITSTPSSACATPAICAPGPWRNGARHSPATALPSGTRNPRRNRSSFPAGRAATTPLCRRCSRQCWPRPRLR